jgi:hypothetical protein
MSACSDRFIIAVVNALSYSSGHGPLTVGASNALRVSRGREWIGLGSPLSEFFRLPLRHYHDRNG